MIPCDVQAIPFLRNGSLYFEIKENCFIFEGKVFETLYVCNTTKVDILRDIKYSHDDRYVMTEDYENVTHYRREDKRIGLFRVVYCDYDFHAKEYDFGIFVDGKCGFYNPVQEKFTLPPQFDFVCWWEDETGNETAFASNGCILNKRLAKGFMGMTEECGFPEGGEWYRVKSIPGRMKFVVPVEYADVFAYIKKVGRV